MIRNAKGIHGKNVIIHNVMLTDWFARKNVDDMVLSVRSCYKNTMLFPFRVNSNTIELTLHTSCYCVLDLLCVNFNYSCVLLMCINTAIRKEQDNRLLSHF